MATQQDLEEPALVARIAQRDQAALAALYDRFSRPLYALSLKIVGSVEEAEEVVVDVFSQVWRNAGSYDAKRGRVDAWLFLMTRSRSLDRLRARSRAARVTEASEQEAIVEIQWRVADPEADTLLSERADVVRAALAGLSDVQRKALELAYWEGLSQTEIADRTGEPLGTIKTRVRLGLGKLREALGPLWGSPP